MGGASSMSTQALPRMTFEQCLAVERETEFRSEFIDGEVFAMADPSGNHSLIKRMSLQNRTARSRAAHVEAAIANARLHFQARHLPKHRAPPQAGASINAEVNGLLRSLTARETSATNAIMRQADVVKPTLRSGSASRIRQPCSTNRTDMLSVVRLVRDAQRQPRFRRRDHHGGAPSAARKAPAPGSPNHPQRTAPARVSGDALILHPRR